MQKYRVHKFNLKMTTDQENLERFLNTLKGDVVSIVNNVTPRFTPGGKGAEVDYLLIKELITPI